MFSSRIRTCALRPVYTSEAQCVGYTTPSIFLSSLTSVVVVSEMVVGLWKIVFFFSSSRAFYVRLYLLSGLQDAGFPSIFLQLDFFFEKHWVFEIIWKRG